MKKFICAALTALAVLSLSACENSSQEPQPATTTEPASVATTTEATTEPEIISQATAKEIASALLANDAIVESSLSRCQYSVDSERTVTFHEDEMDWYFAPVDDERCPFKSVDDIKIFLNDTYTRRFYENSVYTYIIGAEDYTVCFIDYEGELYQNVTGGGGGGNEWAYDTMTISDITQTSFTAQCGGMTLYEEPVSVSMKIVMDDGLWKIDSFEKN